ncbi:MAG: prolipoprotein diacylglyceryl transferase [Anaerolineae bacterium]|jgi:phosphatidylglycerol:prolipoprotein diacylglycerol transferase
MHPTLFTIGRFSIPTYTILLDLGLILGLVLTYFEGKRQLKDGTLALDLGLWAVIGGIVGGRIGYVLANWQAFAEDWARVLRIWEGGLSFHGAFLGGLLVIVLFALLRQPGERPVSFWELADVVTPGLALGIAFGWAACLMGGCAYGVLGEGFGYAILPDIYGVEASRFATQVASLAFSVVLFAGFWLLRGHWPFAGASFLMYGLLYFSGQFFLEFTRGDEAIYLGPWRLAQWLDLAFALAAAVWLLILWWRANKRALAQEPAETEVPAEVADTAAVTVPIEAEATEQKVQETQVQAGETEGIDNSQP